MFPPHTYNNKRVRHDSLSLVNLSALRIENVQHPDEPLPFEAESSDASDGSGDRKKNSSKGKTLVQHNYHDHARDKCDAAANVAISRGGVATLFPVKLFAMLVDTEASGLSSIIGWQSHGRAFAVRKPKEFTKNVLPLYFGPMKWSSFQRQLNLYGFLRLTRGVDKGSYYHELFLRNREILAYRITRQRIKGTGSRAASNPSAEPDFYLMDPVEDSLPRAAFCGIAAALPPAPRASPASDSSAPASAPSPLGEVAASPRPAVSPTPSPAAPPILPMHSFDCNDESSTSPPDDEEIDMDKFLWDIAFDVGENNKDNNGSVSPPSLSFHESISSLCSEDSALLAHPTRMEAPVARQPLQQQPLQQQTPAASPADAMEPVPWSDFVPPAPLEQQQAQNQHQHQANSMLIFPKQSKPPQLDMDEMSFLKSLFGAKDVDGAPSFGCLVGGGGQANNATSAFHANSPASKTRQRKARTVIGRAA